jgi:hypothetical protein
VICRSTESYAISYSARLLVLAGSLLAAAAMLLTGAARAEAMAPWRITAQADTNVAPGGQFSYFVIANNFDEFYNDRSEITFKGELAPGLTIASIDVFVQDWTMSCNAPVGANAFECTGTREGDDEPHKISFFPTLEVDVDPNASGTLTSAFEVEGAGVPAKQIVDSVIVSPQAAEFGFAAFDLNFSDIGGEASTQAGGHPYSALNVIDFTTRTNPSPVIGPNDPVEDPRNIIVDLPPGVFGNPAALSQCKQVDIARNGIFPRPGCAETSQVGEMYLRTGKLSTTVTPVYNMEPPPGVPARFAFNILGAVTTLDASVRNGADYGARISSPDTLQAIQVNGTTLEFWGVPFAPERDLHRNCRGELYYNYFSFGNSFGNYSCAVTDDPVPFLRMPTSCTPAGTGLPVSGKTDSWQDPGDFKSVSMQTHEAPGYPLPPGPSTFPVGYSGPEEWGAPVGTENCGDVPFEPSFSVAPTTNQADSPTGLAIDIELPSDCWDAKETPAEAEAAICQSDMKAAEVTLPQGLAVNPSSASGREACSPAQIGLTTPVGQTPAYFTDTPASCPNASKIGTVEIETPLLGLHDPEGEPVLDAEGKPVPTPLKGALYLAQQSQNPFGSLLAVYLEAEGEGVHIKQAGQIKTDAGGRVTTSFGEVPQAPFSHLHVELFGGPRAALRTPPTCGTYSTQATLTPYSGNGAVALSDPFQITNCPNSGFDPKISAGTENPLAGTFSPFHLRLYREDGTAEFGRLKLALPPGLVASLKGIEYCPDEVLAAISDQPGTGAAQIASPTCPAGSLVGTVSAGAGSGPTPFFVDTGRAYWAGPYKGAPVSLAVVVPAVAGPFDLGNTVVRNRFAVDPTTAKITAISDPLPTILHGIPLDVRDVRVDLTRPDYTLNPTSCEPLAFQGVLDSPSGLTAERSIHFQAAGCDRLRFKPKIALRLHGKTTRGAHPALEAIIRMPKKGTNLQSAKVSLPPSEFLDQAHIGTVCTRVQFAAGAGGGAECPKRSIYGQARVYSPILGYYLKGPVFLRSSSHELPDLVLALHGPPAQPIQVEAVGRIDSTKGGAIRSTFEAIPDVPVSKVVLNMRGGRRGLLQNSANMCKGEHRAKVYLEAHNGALLDLSPPLKADCGKSKARKGKNPYRR